MDKKFEKFINDEKSRAYNRVAIKIEREYISRPGYKKGELKKYRKTEEYEKAVLDARDTDPLYIALNSEHPENEPIVQEAFQEEVERQKEVARIEEFERNKNKLENEAAEWLEENKDDVESELEDIIDKLEKEAVMLQRKCFLIEEQSFLRCNFDDYRLGQWYDYRCGNRYLYKDKVDLDIDSWQEYMDVVSEDGFEEEDVAGLFKEEWLCTVVYNRYFERHPELKKYEDYIMDDINDLISWECGSILRAVQDYFTIDKIEELLRQNPHYEEMFQEMDEADSRREAIIEALAGKIPENPVELFPLTRRIKRKVILHVGPTNSGKTHDAIERLKSAESGIYLAPLRLMAYETFERLNNDGVPCIMETGEEYKQTENAKHYAKTIELFDPFEKYDVAVIDEAQMIADSERGGAWSNAIMGVYAPEVHVCMSPDAEKRIIEILNDCGDDIEIVRHERKTELIVEDDKFIFPKSVQKGDALIVFSKRNVITCAADLQEKGYRCSIIYGALPYDVRQNEVNRFLTGETDVVVSTDAIGMGMNLPVRRIVFLETQKFDGTEKRRLKPTEIKQIAGRAGRYGLYDIGYCTSEYDRKFIKNGLDCNNNPISNAVLSFPESVIVIDGKLSVIMEQWQKMEIGKGYKKANISALLLLTKEMEKLTDDKKLTYSFATIPFDTNNMELFDIWKNLVKKVVSKKELFLDSYVKNAVFLKDSLDGLEALHKQYDLLYNFARRTKDVKAMEILMQEKEKISGFIMELLKKRKLQKRKCKYCKKNLAWNYPYGMCGKCHDNMYSPRRWNDDWGDDWY